MNKHLKENIQQNIFGKDVYNPIELVNKDKKILGIKSENIVISFLLLTVLPFIILFYFNHPTTEDFYYIDITKNTGFLDAQRFFHKFWGGRYFYYALISTNPLIFKSIAGYNVLALILMLAFFCSIILFISEITKNSLTFREKLLFSLSIIFYIYTTCLQSGRDFTGLAQLSIIISL